MKSRSQKSGVRSQKKSKLLLKSALMTKGTLSIVLLLLLVSNLDGIVLANETSGSSLMKPDGVAVTKQRRRKRHQTNKQRAKVYGIKVAPGEAGGAPPPPPPPPEPVQEAPNEAPAAAPPPKPTIDASKPGGAKKAAPRIKPPTVQIKPPTE